MEKRTWDYADSAEGVQRKLQEFQGKDTTITLSNCEVKHSRQGQQLEIFLGKNSQVEVSAKEFDVTALPDMRYWKTIWFQ